LLLRQEEVSVQARLVVVGEERSGQGRRRNCAADGGEEVTAVLLQVHVLF
jgi:hypothetical protein